MSSRRLSSRLNGIDWAAVRERLESDGVARVPRLLLPSECRILSASFEDQSRFRKRIDMARHRFGEGSYAYFADPLPPLVRSLRSGIFRRLAGEAFVLGQGEMIVFPVRERPVRGARGSYTASIRHGLSRVRRGHRDALGIIFHLAR